jgi:hypothetical protein
MSKMDVFGLVSGIASIVLVAICPETALPRGLTRQGLLIALSLGLLITFGKVLYARFGERRFPLSRLIIGVAAIELLCLLWLVVGW